MLLWDDKVSLKRKNCFSNSVRIKSSYPAWKSVSFPLRHPSLIEFQYTSFFWRAKITWKMGEQWSLIQNFYRVFYITTFPAVSAKFSYDQMNNGRSNRSTFWWFYLLHESTTLVLFGNKNSNFALTNSWTLK